MTVHFIGIGGRAMGAVAIALADAGHNVSGSDENLYEPMRGELARAGIHVSAYAAQRVTSALDRVIAGRRISPDNPEWVEAGRLGLPRLSFPTFLREQFLTASRNVVVSGGVGKTTTTAMVAWILEHAGCAPDYLVGGLARNLPAPARLRGGAITVIEGDEYAAGPDDSAPKFLHYPPEVVVVTNLLADHPDLYPDESSLFGAFAALVGTIPDTGCLVVSADDPAVVALAAHAVCPVVAVGTGASDPWRVSRVEPSVDGTSFVLGDTDVHVPMTGRMNVRNAAMAIAAAAHAGVAPAVGAEALRRFLGLADRQEAVEVGPCVLVRDKASHPASIAELAPALRQRFPGRRIVVALQPRATGGRRWIYQRDLPQALAAFDHVVLAPPYEHRPPAHVPWEDEPFSLEALEGAVAGHGTPVTRTASVFELPAAVAALCADGDVVLGLVREQFAAVLPALEQALRDRLVSA